ncbi:MAG TPA: hypothetical protein VMF59_14535, partial [Bacteroidota bacterium]|nr:hypothetical protein [Bacteroidota bacterium]
LPTHPFPGIDYPMSSNDTAIEVENLVKIYNPGSAHPVRALDGLSLAVQQGEIFGLLGRTGPEKRRC